MSAWVVMVRDDNDESDFYGPFLKRERAERLAEGITSEIDRLDPDYEGPAWAYAIRLQPGALYTALALANSAWDPDATR